MPWGRFSSIWQKFSPEPKTMKFMNFERPWPSNHAPGAPERCASAQCSNKRNLQRWTSESNTPAGEICWGHRPNKRRKFGHKSRKVYIFLQFILILVESRPWRIFQGIVWTYLEVLGSSMWKVMAPARFYQYEQNWAETWKSLKSWILNTSGSETTILEFQSAAPARNVQIPGHLCKEIVFLDY